MTVADVATITGEIDEWGVRFFDLPGMPVVTYDSEEEARNALGQGGDLVKRTTVIAVWN